MSSALGCAPRTTGFKESVLVQGQHQTVGGGGQCPLAYLSVWCWPAIPAKKVSLGDKSGAGGTQVCEVAPPVLTLHTRLCLVKQFSPSQEGRGGGGSQESLVEAESGGLRPVRIYSKAKTKLKCALASEGEALDYAHLPRPAGPLTSLLPSLGLRERGTRWPLRPVQLGGTLFPGPK